ncbi:MAG: MerR family transcriptional regulator [Clostridiaceae bacterium]
MTTYRTSEIAKQAGLHPNTIRFYEQIGFLTKPVRLPNGYRVYTPLHLEQVRFIRIALRAEVLQNGLRSLAVGIIRLCAACRWREALRETSHYIEQIDREIGFAKSAILLVEATLARDPSPDSTPLTRSDAALALGVTIDTLRNWERNGLVSIYRMQNGYRMYTSEDMERLLIIRTLRCANYSLSAILRLTGELSHSREIQVSEALNTPDENEEIVSVCDHLLTSLSSALEDAQEMLVSIEHMKNITTLQ